MQVSAALPGWDPLPLPRKAMNCWVAGDRAPYQRPLTAYTHRTHTLYKDIGGRICLLLQCILLKRMWRERERKTNERLPQDHTQRPSAAAGRAEPQLAQPPHHCQPPPNPDPAGWDGGSSHSLSAIPELKDWDGGPCLVLFPGSSPSALPACFLT